MLCAKESEKPKVLLLAPTGVAAINIEGTTIHSGLGIPIGHHGKNVPRLGDKMRSKLRNKLSEVGVIIIDEKSMVSNLLLLYIHQRLTEVFGCSEDLRFAGISVIVFGDFYQLPWIVDLWPSGLRCRTRDPTVVSSNPALGHQC